MFNLSFSKRDIEKLRKKGYSYAVTRNGKKVTFYDQEGKEICAILYDEENASLQIEGHAGLQCDEIAIFVAADVENAVERKVHYSYTSYDADLDLHRCNITIR